MAAIAIASDSLWDRYVSAFLDRRVYVDETWKRPDRIGDAIEVLRTSALTTYENRRISTGALLFGTSPDPCHELPECPPGALRYSSALTAAKTYQDLERVVHKAVGTSELMAFARFDLGEILRKQRGNAAPRSLRLVAGNPLIIKQMLEHVPDAGSYAPFTILIDERPDGVHLSYDRMRAS